MLSKSLMYCGPILFRALKVNSRILYSIRLRTGSQCNLARIGEICSYFLVPVRSRAAEFSMHCRLSNKQELIPYHRVTIVQMSLELTKAWINFSVMPS